MNFRYGGFSLWIRLRPFTVRLRLQPVLRLATTGGMRCRPTACYGWRHEVLPYGLRHEQVYVGFEFSLMLVVADSPAPLMVASASFMDDSKSCSTIFTSC